MTDTIDPKVLQLLEVKPVRAYRQMMAENLMAHYPKLSYQELDEAIKWAIINNHHIRKATLDNNYTKQTIEGTALDVLRFMETHRPIETASGVLYKRHDEIANPLSKMIQGFLKQRKAYKKEMFKHPRGSYEYNMNDLMQNNMKVMANSCYGALGNNSCLFYNVYVAEAITTQGRSYISASITLFEALLADNIKFNSLNEIITFITNVIHEAPQRKFDDNLILRGNINPTQCFVRIMQNVDPLVLVPTDKQMALVWERILALPQEELNRLYYKNNLYEFCSLQVMHDLIINILCTLQSPYMNPYNPPDEIKDLLDDFVELLKEYVYYGYPYIDKLDRIEYMKRDVTLISDTDSTILSFDMWYRFVLGMCYNIDMPIKHQKRRMYDLIEEDEWGDKPKRKLYEVVEPCFDYNFYTDEVVEIHRARDLYHLIPQDALRYSIINILSYACSNFITDYLNRYCEICGSHRESIPSVMSMKTEFTFESILLTANQRNYASVMSLQEGNPIPDNQKARLTLAGLQINKSTLLPDIKKKLQDILYEDVMTAIEVDQVGIMKKLIVIEKDIIKSIQNKETKYYKPDNISPMRFYEEPLRNNGIVASLIYNELRSEDMPLINLEQRNVITKIKIKVDKNNVDLIKDKYPEVHKKLVALMNHPTLGGRLTTIALPVEVEVPDWVLYFVDIATIVNDNLKNFPLESIGLRRLENDSVNYSNIISL